MSKYHPFGGQTYNLGTSISSTDTTILLSSFLEPVTGTPYTMVLLNTDIAYATIAPKTTSSEFVSFSGITQNADGTATLTGVVRGLAKKYPFTTDAAYKLPHSGQTQFIISDAPQVFEKYVTLEDTETITGIKTFTTSPAVPTATSSDIHEAASIEYVNNASFAGVVNASTTVKGIVELATQAEVDARTTTGGSGALLVPTPDTTRSTLLSDYKVDTGSANAYAIAPSPVITAYTVGQIFSFKAVNANTTASTLNVNGLGTKALVNSKGGALVANDILAGMIVTVEYDGTSMVMQNPVANTPTINTVRFGGTGADGSLILTSTTQNYDMANAIYFEKNFTSISITGTGKVTFTNPNSAGTLIIFKSQGAVTLTASAPCIDASGMGADGGSISGTVGTGSNFRITDSVLNAGQSPTGGLILSQKAYYTKISNDLYTHRIHLAPGSGGGAGTTAAGGGTFGAGGKGGGAFYMECGGSLNFTTALGISVAGLTGGNATAGANAGGGGGGGGAGGMCILLYNTLTSASGTINTIGGSGGSGSVATSSGATSGSPGGGGAGSYATAGGLGGAGGGVASSGASGGSPASGSAGGGGGGGGGAGNGSSGGPGGGGGAGGASDGNFVALNTVFN